jgi:hypothetical protein
MVIHFGGKIFSIIYNTAEDMETSVVIHVAGNALGNTILVKTIGEGAGMIGRHSSWQYGHIIGKP